MTGPAAARPIGALAAALVLAACGSDGDPERASATLPPATSSSVDGGTTTPPPTTTEADPAPTSTAAPASNGLAHCTDIPPVSTDVLGNGRDGLEDPIVFGVFLSYGMERPDTFGGLWIDREARGTIVLGFTDDPEPHRLALLERAPSPDDVAAVQPPPSIDDDRPLGERDDVIFDVVRVDHAEAALLAEQATAVTAAFESRLGIGGLGVDIMRSRVSLSPDDGRMTTDEVAALAEVLRAADVDLSMMCVDGEVIDGPEPDPPFAAGDELDVIDLPADDGVFPPDTDVECGGLSFRLGDLDSMTPYAEIDPDLRVVLDDWLASGEGAFLPADGWELLVEEEGRALFVHIRSDSVSYVGAERGANGWIWSGGGGGPPCDVRRPVPDGLSQVDWELTTTPTPDATTIELTATERACTGGSEMGDRLLPADVVETENAVRIALAAVALVGGQTCPSNPSTPVTISLDAPLGDRIVIDGLLVGPLVELVDR